MIDKVLNVLTNPTLVSAAQNTKSAVTIETSLKAAGRPAFTMMDKSVDEKTRKYSAAKELLYQGLCLGIYLGLIIPVFKKKTFGIFKKMYKDIPDFNKFKNADEYLNYHKLATIDNKAVRLKDAMFSKLPSHLQEELRKDKTEKFVLGKGAIELSSIVGSVLGLTIIAPELSHLVLHPIMKAIGMEKGKPKSPARPQPPAHNQPGSEQKLDKKA